VTLELQFSSFSGYDSSETSAYLGTQCHGVIWPETTALPAAWPIAPPIVSGKVRACAQLGALLSSAAGRMPRFGADPFRASLEIKG
jgi:hypothetical protein